MPQIFGNNAASTLSSVLAIGATTAFVQTGHGSRFPVVSGADFAFCSLEDSAGNIEIVKVTAHTSGSTSLTIARAQQGTAARAWASGDLIELRMTAAEATRWEAVATDAAIAPGAPGDVTGFALTASINGGILRWDANGETNVRNYELRRGGTDWATASPLYGGTETLIGGTAHVWLPPASGTYTIRIKATNNAGTQSANAASATAALLGPEILNNAMYVQYTDPVSSPGGVTDGATWIQTDSGGSTVVCSKLRVGGAWVLSVRDIQGNAATATTAAACSGNSATATYATSAGTAAACSGNSATATTAASCSGNSATATTATNATNATTAASCSGNSATATVAASCSGNAATATTAASCSGNAATATNATNATTAASCSGNAATASSVNAGNLTGATLAAGVTASSLTSVGTLSNLTSSGYIQGQRLIAGYDSGVGGSVNSSDWFRTNANTGLFFATKSTGLQPPQRSYGSVACYGSFGSYSGIETDSSNTLMGNGSTWGHYNQPGSVWMMQSDYSGNVTFAGNVTAYSDRRLKTDIAPIRNALDRLLTITGVTYRRIDSGERGIGVIAQDVQAEFPEVVSESRKDAEGDETLLTVAYGNLVGPIIEALREIDARLRVLGG